MSESLTTSLYIHTENIAASVIIAVVGLFGLVSNGTAMLAVRCNQALRNSFGLLCFSHCIANMGVLIVFAFWITPLTLIQSEMVAELIGKLIGLVSVMLWNVCVYSHLAISMNRIIAITLPLQASKILTVKNTSYVVFFCWTLGFCHVIPYFWTESCFIVFNTITWEWTFASTPCGYIISIFTDFYTGMAVFVVTFLLDSITLVCLRVRHMRMSSQSGGGIYDNLANQKRRNTEIRLFTQTLYQNALFFYELVSFHYISLLFESQWGVFFTTTFIWETCHALDGFIVALFHFRFSNFRMKVSNTK